MTAAFLAELHQRRQDGRFESLGVTGFGGLDIATARALDRQAARDDAAAGVYTEAKDDFLAGWQYQPDTHPLTHSNGETLAAEVYDAVSGADKASQDSWHELLRIVGDASRGEDVSLRAQLLLSIMAGQYAERALDRAVERGAV